MKHIKRTSNSAESPVLVEYLQGGILIRFNIVEEVKEDVTSFTYDEFWFSRDSDEDYIRTVVNESGFYLLKKYKDLLIK